MKRRLSLALGACTAALLCARVAAAPSPALAAAAKGLWPLPQQFSCVNGSAGLAADLRITTASRSDIAGAAIERYRPLLLAGGTIAGTVSGITVSVRNEDESLGVATDYSYSVSMPAGAANISVAAASPYGVAYALETITQLLAGGKGPDAGSLQCASFSINDAPRFSHRGLMVDTGRRFYPMDLMRATLDAMAANKMNVLHFHLSEECFRVESKVYPQLTTAACEAGGRTNDESYSQADIAALVRYAKEVSGSGRVGRHSAGRQHATPDP